MGLHGIWSGTLSFSLVAIPVQLVKAVEPGRVSFRMLHSKDYAPLARKMFCPKIKRWYPPEEIVRGFEIAPDHYLVITDEELASVSPERSRTIEIIEFIDMREVDPIYFEHPYYLVPIKRGRKSLPSLGRGDAATNKAGIAKFVLHEREHLVAVKSTEGALALITLHYRAEILPEADMLPAEGKIDAKAKSRIIKSIETMLADFNPGRYADTRREKLMDLLEEMAKTKATVEAPEVEKEAGEGPADLVAALEESMRKMKKNLHRVKKHR